MTATTLRRIATLARRTGFEPLTTREGDARLGRNRPRLRANFRSRISVLFRGCCELGERPADHALRDTGLVEVLGDPAQPSAR